MALDDSPRTAKIIRLPWSVALAIEARAKVAGISQNEWMVEALSDAVIDAPQPHRWPVRRTKS